MVWLFALILSLTLLIKTYPSQSVWLPVSQYVGWARFLTFKQTRNGRENQRDRGWRGTESVFLVPEDSMASSRITPALVETFLV